MLMSSYSGNFLVKKFDFILHLIWYPVVVLVDAAADDDNFSFFSCGPLLVCSDFTFIHWIWSLKQMLDDDGVIEESSDHICSLFSIFTQFEDSEHVLKTPGHLFDIWITGQKMDGVYLGG